jgi:hypothetical protein
MIGRGAGVLRLWGRRLEYMAARGLDLLVGLVPSSRSLVTDIV